MATVLLLDRDRRSCRELYSLLQARFAVIALHGTFRAFQYLRHHKLDLVIVKTSGKDAFATAILTWLRELELSIPTIVLIGHAASREVTPVRQLGAKRILHCPLSRDQFLATVAAEIHKTGDRAAASIAPGTRLAQTHGNLRRAVPLQA